MSWEVTELQPQKRKKNRFNIITDEGYLRSLSAETIVKHHIRAGMILEEELLEKLREIVTELCYLGLTREEILTLIKEGDAT